MSKIETSKFNTNFLNTNYLNTFQSWLCRAITQITTYLFKFSILIVICKKICTLSAIAIQHLIFVALQSKSLNITQNKTFHQPIGGSGGSIAVNEFMNRIVHI